jgi:polysaccharide biosynthesis transport protein
MKLPRFVVSRRSIVATAVFSAVIASLLLTATYDRVYRAEAVLLMRDDVDVAKEVVLMRSLPMRAAVAHRLGAEGAPEPTIERRGSTQQLSIVVRSGDPATAAAVANAYADAYIEYRGTTPDTSAYDRAMADLDASLVVAQHAIDTIESRRDVYGNLTPDDQLLRQLFAAQLADLEVQVDALRNDPASLVNAQQLPAATVQTKATLPGEPVEPRVVRSALIAALAGLLIGIIAIVIAERNDDTLRHTNDLLAIRRRMPIIGRIPHDPSLQRRPVNHRRRIDDASVSSVHLMRDEVLFLGLEPPTRVIQVCGASPGSGATTIATELALALSDYSSVVLVDLNLRSPDIHHVLGVDDSIGLVDNLDTESIDMTLYPVEERLAVITAGRPPAQPLGMLSRVRLDMMMAELRDRYDVVVLDTPDLQTYGDSTMIARLADAVIVVTRLGVTPTSAVRNACRELERVRATIMGFVVNDA